MFFSAPRDLELTERSSKNGVGSGIDPDQENLEAADYTIIA